MNSNENSHEPLVERALMGFDLAAEHHLSNCEPCQQERERVQEALNLFAAAERESANRPEIFWEQQAARIRAARNDQVKKSRMALALTPGLAVLLLMGFALITRSAKIDPKPAPISRAVAPAISDQELLMEVERAVQSGTPLSLEPATLMVEEDAGSMPINSQNASKELRSNEN